MINKKNIFFIIIILIFIFGIFLVNSSSNKNKISGEVYSALNKEGSIRVTIRIKEPLIEKKLYNQILSDSEIKKQKAKLIEDIGKEKIIHDFGNSLSIQISKKELDELGNNLNIESITVPKKIYAFLQDSVPLINSTNVWPIQLSGFNITGVDETICILDTGINFSHSDLIGKNKSCIINCITQDCVENCSIGDDNGHGTHVAGIAAASGGINGVAKSANLIGVKVLNSAGSGNGDDLNAAIDWCIVNRNNYNISVISMSLGDCSNHSTYCNDDSSASHINNATTHNISVVVAAGNGPVGGCTGVTTTAGPAAPACIQNATAVGAVNDNDVISYQRGALFELLAPGIDINSTKGNSCLSGCTCSGNYMSCSGTSMATPHVAGAFALIRQFFRLQNNRVPTPSEIQSLLNNTGKRIDDSTGSGYNFSRIDVWSALISIDSSNPTVNLISPLNATIQFSQNVTFRCSANDVLLSNITLYIWNSSRVYNNTEIRTFNSVNGNAEFNLTNITYGSYKWNCLAYDSKGNFSFAASNYSFFVRAGAPVFGVLHSIHTTISDGKMSQSQRVSNLKSEYDWASTVEHDNWTNADEWTSIKNESNGNNSDNNFTYFVGYEWRGVNFNNGEILVFFKDNGPTTKINGNDTDYDTPSELISWLSSNNGIGCINHPARTSNYINWSNSEINNQSYLPCVEILNKQYYHWNDYWNCSENSGCTTYANPKPDTSNWNGGIKKALDNGLHLGFVAGWDYHGSYPANPSAYTGLINAPNWTREGLFETIKNRHTWAAEDKIIMDVRISNGSNTLTMGDIFNTSYNGIYLNFSINATAGKNISNLSLFYDGIIINLTQFSNQQNVSGFFNLTFSNNNEHYIFIEAVENDGNRSWSSPVYITYRDLIPPLITINSPSPTIYSSSSIIFNVSLNENGYCEYFLTSGTTNYTMSSIDNKNWNATQSLSDGSYTVNFYCNDSAGNNNYTESVSFTIDTSPPSVTISGGGGVSYITYTPTTEQIAKGYTQTLSKNDKIKFTFFDEKAGQHTLIVDYIGDNFVNLTIQSSIVRLMLGIEQSAKLNLTSSDYYDLYIKLNSIENNKAKLTIQTIHEEIPKPKITGQVAEEKEEKEKKETEKSEEEIEAKEERLRKEIIDKIKNLLIIILIVSVLILLAERITREKKLNLKRK